MYDRAEPHTGTNKQPFACLLHGGSFVMRDLLRRLFAYLSREELTYGKFRAKGTVALVIGSALAWRIATGDFAAIQNIIAMAWRIFHG
jgi:hypothetical protein